MAQSFDREILKYLERKENLSQTLEIGNYAAKLRRELFDKFWKSVEDAIVKSRPQGSAAAEFIFRGSNLTDASYNCLRAIPKAAATKSQQLAFGIEREFTTKGYDLYIGLRWAVGVPASHPSYQRSPLKELKQRLAADGWEVWPNLFVCGHYVTRFPSPEAFLCEFAADPVSVIKPLTTAFWEMVGKTEVDVTAINKLLKGNRRSSTCSR